MLEIAAKLLWPQMLKMFLLCVSVWASHKDKFTISKSQEKKARKNTYLMGMGVTKSAAKCINFYNNSIKGLIKSEDARQTGGETVLFWGYIKVLLL